MRFPLCLSLPLGAAIRESSDLTAPLLFNTQNALNKLLLYYINTDQGTSRRLHMQEQASELALPLHRFRAVDSIAIASGLYDDKYILAQGVDSNLHAAGRDHTQNATIACFVSHVELLAEIAGSFSGDCIVLIMEDDVLIPADVLQRITHALECAPPDWTLLKVSSWGAVRSSNVVRQKRSVWQAFIFQLQSLLSVMDFEGFVRMDRQCPDAYRMAEPFTESPPPVRSLLQSYPDYYYAGTAAYMVQVRKIPTVLEHLRSRPIGDIDRMMLLPENLGDARMPCVYCPYQIWPYVVQLGWRHWISTLLPPAEVKRRLAAASFVLITALGIAILGAFLVVCCVSTIPLKA